VFEFATVEWIWEVGAIRLNLPNGVEQNNAGSYKEVVALLSALGAQGWDVATCTAAGNWLFWTLRRTGRAG
jgi:hypothetical protein